MDRALVAVLDGDGVLLFDDVDDVGLPGTEMFDEVDHVGEADADDVGSAVLGAVVDVFFACPAGDLPVDGAVVGEDSLKGGESLFLLELDVALEMGGAVVTYFLLVDDSISMLSEEVGEVVESSTGRVVVVGEGPALALDCLLARSRSICCSALSIACLTFAWWKAS